MPIPHLQHKIHSPNHQSKSWQDDPLNRAQLNKRRMMDIRFPGQKKAGWFKTLKRFWPHLAVLFLLFLIGGFAAFAWLSKDLPDPYKLTERSVAQSTKIYDRTGEHLLYEIHGEQKRTIIPLAEIPTYAIQATLALEDQRFYEHKGISFWGIFRGVVLRAISGERVQGGSTLTQQLIKNAVLTNERTLARKIKELIMAYRLERKYTKEEILQMYFNEIPYGSTAYGIEAAAFTYFGKSARELTLAQAALIAALPKAPSYLSPYGSHTDELFGRQQYGLDQMVKLGYLTQEEAAAAKAEKMDFKNKIEGIEAPHFVFFVKELLSEKYGEKLIEQGGWKIISTLDFDLQKKAEKIIEEQVAENQKNFNAGNAALVAIDVKTGQILAMVGSMDFFNEEIDGQVNVAISPRQPGSSFKPIVYAAAFKKGYVPETAVYDLETVFPTLQGDYFPHDYDLKERGPVSLRTALAGSLNIPAVKMIYLAGIENVLNLADELEYTTLKDRSRFGLSLVLGGGEVKLLEHTNAYAAFARDGKKMKYEAVLKLEDETGRALEKFQEPRSQEALEPNISRMVTDILSDNSARAFIFGENNYLTLPDRPVAAKTGTTNNYHDAWTLGYTPQIAVGVWVGNSDNAEMKKGADGSRIAAPIWQRLMKEAHVNLPVENFTKPIYAVPQKPMLGGDASGVKVKIDKITGLLATEATPPQLIEERTYKQAHEILHYISKDDPLGPIPEHPENDEYYKYWEDPVQKWAQKNGIINERPPITSDNLHRVEDRPTVNLTSPGENDNIAEPLLNLSATASSPRGVRRVEFYLDQTILTTSVQPPYQAQAIIPPNILQGQHIVTAKAYDDLENMGSDSVTINLSGGAYLNVEWLEPQGGITVRRADFPLALLLNVNDLSKVKKVDFYFKEQQNQNSSWLGTIESPAENNLRFNWQEPPEAGVYKLYPLITAANNQTLAGPEITISVE